MYLFLIPMLLGFSLGGASAFTAAYSRRWVNEAAKRLLLSCGTSWAFHCGLSASSSPGLRRHPPLFSASTMTQALSWLLIAAGSVPVIWGHRALGLRTHMPSVRDTLVRHGVYAHVRHPIYAGALLIFVGLALLRPTTVVLPALSGSSGPLSRLA